MHLSNQAVSPTSSRNTKPFDELARELHEPLDRQAALIRTEQGMHVDASVNEREPNEPEPMSPVRDDTALGRGEDLDRTPGGFPHAAMAMTAGFAIAIAGLLLFALIGRSIVAVVLCAILIPVAILLLKRESSRERGSIHPSR